MWLASLFLGLAAVYFPAVIAAKGLASRRLWIGLIPAALFVGVVSMTLGHHLVRSFDLFLFSESAGLSLGRRIIADLLSLIVRTSISLCFGSFLAALLYRKPIAASPSLPGLGSGR
jgi:hypothetical protein